MTADLQPVDLAAFFASLDRRLEERPNPAEGEVDEARRDIELQLAELDKQLVLLGMGEGDLDLPMGQRVADRLRRLDDDDWAARSSVDPGDRSETSLLQRVREVAAEASRTLRS
ncbi:MAG: hypothetical protein AB7W59_02450 [Acidimicrobiia bacterium]